MLQQRIVGLTTVADIQAASRYVAGGADLARITHTVLFDAAVETTEVQAAYGGEATVTADASGLLHTVVDNVPVAQGAESQTYSLSLTSPPAGFELIKLGDISVTYLLPRSGIYPDGPLYEVELVTASADGATPVVFDGTALPMIGGRIVVAFRLRQDPESLVEWAYSKLRERLP